MLNPHSPLPLYRQLASLLEQRIENGDFAPGDRIPSEPELAKTHAIGRPTVRQAIDLLVRRRRLERRRGAGTFVADRRHEVDLFTLGGTVAAFRSQGMSIETTLLAPPRRLVVSSGRHHPLAGNAAFLVRRLSTISGKPVLLEAMYLDAGTFADLDRLPLEGRSISEVVRDHYHLRPCRGQQVFSVVRLRATKARILGVQSGEPALLVRRTLDFPQSTAAFYARIHCLTDQVVLSQTLAGEDA